MANEEQSSLKSGAGKGSKQQSNVPGQALALKVLGCKGNHSNYYSFMETFLHTAELRASSVFQIVYDTLKRAKNLSTACLEEQLSTFTKVPTKN